MRSVKVIIIFLVIIATMFLSTITAYADENELNLYVQNKEEAELLISLTAGKLKGNYHGYCGQYIHDILYKTGIIKRNSYAYNGKDWFTSYKKGSYGNKLEDNWTYECFEGKDALKQILEKYNGKVYNLVFSMNSGSQYGHAFFVNAIVDDMVYYTESFGSAYLGANQKQLISISLDKFIDYYINSSYYRAEKGGIIHFYEKDFYQPIISFDNQESVSSDYVYEYANQNKIENDMMYQDMLSTNILYQDKIYLDTELYQQSMTIWHNVKTFFNI